MLRRKPSGGSDIRTWRKYGVALALSWAAGFVDAVCYLALMNVFVANMTGNTIAGGAGLADGNWSLALRRGFAIPMFVIGMFLSRFWMRLAGRRNISGIAATVAYGSEAALLLLFVWIGSGYIAGGEIVADTQAMFFLLIALPALAMGLQNATLSHFGPLSVRTTHVTGTLAKFVDEAVQYIFWLFDAIARYPGRGEQLPVRKSLKQKSLHRALLFLTAWFLYALGAFLGVDIKQRWELSALYLPVAVLVLVVVMDRVWPLAPSKQVS